MLQVPNESIRSRRTKSQRISPKVPLEDDYGEGTHTSPDHGKCGLSTRETRVEEAETGGHEKDHTCWYDDECLVTGIKPLIEIYDGYIEELRLVVMKFDYLLRGMLMWCECNKVYMRECTKCGGSQSGTRRFRKKRWKHTTITTIWSSTVVICRSSNVAIVWMISVAWHCYEDSSLLSIDLFRDVSVTSFSVRGGFEQGRNACMNDVYRRCEIQKIRWNIGLLKRRSCYGKSNGDSDSDTDSDSDSREELIDIFGGGSTTFILSQVIDCKIWQNTTEIQVVGQCESSQLPNE